MFYLQTTSVIILIIEPLYHMYLIKCENKVTYIDNLSYYCILIEFIELTQNIYYIMCHGDVL